jgi:hypothetical protein
MRNKASSGEKYFRIRRRLEQSLDARCFETTGGCIRQLKLKEALFRGCSVQVLVKRLCFSVHDTCRGVENQRT